MEAIIVTLVVVLIVIGLLVAGVEYLPVVDGRFKRLIQFAVIVIGALWLLTEVA